MSDEKKLIIPAKGHAKEIQIRMGKIKEAEKRTYEAQFVNVGTYGELEYCYNEAFRDSTQVLGQVYLQIANIKKSMEERKADIILQIIPDMLEGKPKSANNADFRNAVIAKDEQYQEYADHLAKLEALQIHFEGVKKHMTETCRAMRKTIDLIREGKMQPIINTGDKL
jgi:hypothetical protein